MEKTSKRKNVFVEGPISPSFISDSIAKHSTKHSIGAHSIFLGQVRDDEKEGGKVTAIEYTAYTDMAEEVFHTIREETFSKFSLTCMHIYHSLGTVKTGEISLFVFVSAPHRKVVFEALEWLVNKIKSDVPVWGKEIISTGNSVWKENK